MWTPRGPHQYRTYTAPGFSFPGGAGARATHSETVVPGGRPKRPRRGLGWLASSVRGDTGALDDLEGPENDLEADELLEKLKRQMEADKGGK